MIVSKIPGISDDLESLREIATSGFVLAINVRWIGPEFLHSEFPAKWRKLYEDKNYFMFDPIYFWIVANTGEIRWSEVGLPDLQGVQKKAAEHGLVYGATVCKKRDGQKSLLSAARPDREITAPEMEKLSGYLDKWLSVVSERPILTEGEFDTLKLLRDGLDQNEIAQSLGVSTSTVKKRLKGVRQKFDAATVAEALSIAVEKRYFSGV